MAWAGSLTAIVLAIGATVVLSLSGPATDRAEALPVFALPPVDASQIRAATEVLARGGADYEHARVINTPSGKGYVVAADNDSVCLAMPDPGDGFAQSCATQAQVEKRGLIVELSSRTGDTSQLVVVIPAGTTAATLRDGHGSRPLQVTEGILTASATGNATVSYRTAAGGEVKLSLGEHPLRCFGVLPGTSDQAVRETQQQSGLPPCNPPAGG
jgi:hypothetical protein